MLQARLHLLLATSLATLAIATAAAHAGYDESTAFQVTPGHTGFASGGSLERPPLQTRWSRTLGTSTQHPLIAQGRVYILAYSAQVGNTLFALDATSGATLWSRPIAGSAEIAYDSGRVFISDSSGTVTAVAAATGVTHWSRNLPEPFELHRPVAADGVVYVNSAWSGGEVWALDAGDGSTQWTAPFYYGGSPGLDGTFLYISDDYEGSTRAFARSDGRPAWSGTKQCFVGSGNIVVDGARVFAPFNSGCGAVVDAGSGRQLDSVSSYVAPASAGDVAVTLNGTTLRARSLRTGVLLWDFTGDGRLSSPPVIVNETVYAGSSSGTLFAIDLRSGAQLWSGLVGGAASPGAAGMAAGGGLLVAPAGGNVVALESARAVRPGLDLRITGGPDGPTNATSATLAFGATAPTAQRCRLDGGAWSPCASGATFLGLADGPHMFEVESLDAADGSVIALATRGWSIDTDAPAAAVKGPPALTGSFDAYLSLSQDEWTAAIDCRLDGAPWATCTSTTPEIHGLPDGTHTYEVRARDAVGNVQDPPAALTWRIDTVKPESTIHSGPQGATTATSGTFAFSAGEPATFNCSLDGSPWAPCTSPYAMSGIAGGTHSFRVYATDAAGNVEAMSAVRTWNVGGDAIAPNTSITAAPPAVTAGTSAHFDYISDDSGTFECRVDNASSWHECGWWGEDAARLDDGPHTFEVRAIDEGGNVDASPASWSWAVDTDPPTTTIATAPVAGTTATFTFVADEDATFECQMDSGTTSPCASGVEYAALSAGRHDFVVRAVDVAGNREPGGATKAFTITPTSPSPSSPAAGAPAKPTSAVPTNGSSATTAVPSMSSSGLARLLADGAAAKLKRTSRRGLRRGATIRAYAAEPGVVTIKAITRRGGSTVTVARVRVNFGGAGMRSVRLKPTAAGRRALAQRGALVLQVRATVAPTASQAGSASAAARV